MNRRSLLAAALALLGLGGVPAVRPAREVFVPAPPGPYSAMLQRIPVGARLTREKLFELGKRGPYYRYIAFPVETTAPPGEQA